MSVMAFVVWAVILAPIVWFFARMGINRDATRLIASFRRWRLGRLTGRLVSYSSYTTVSGSGGYSVGDAVAPVSIRTHLHEKLRLELAGGKLRDFELVGFELTPTIGDVITLWIASRYSSESIFAALNHTTESMALNMQELFAMGTGGRMLQSLKGIAAAIFMAFCVIVGIVLQQIAIIMWGWIPWAIWLWRTRYISGFAKRGAKPLWIASAADAQALMAASPAAAPAVSGP